MNTQTKTKHTRGPLPLHYDGHGLNDSGGQRVLTFAKWPDSEGGGYIHTPEARERYAHLITSAPELLKACKAMLNIDNPPVGDAGHIDFSVAVGMAQRAIAKATGEGNV